MATDNEMVEIIKTALAEQPAGLVSVSIDGVTQQFNRSDLRDELEWYEKRVAKAAGRRPRVGRINLGGFRG